MKFARDRGRWEAWLFEARKRHGLKVLNYMVTSNHIHLIVVDAEGEPSIAPAMQLVAGRTAQEYNLRKKRRGAFWEDRYHATAVQSGEHLARCMAYIDMNMVRAGVVRHPGEWRWCGYEAIQNPPRRYRLVDVERAAELLGCGSAEALAAAQRGWVEAALHEPRGREPKWSESLAVGSEAFTQRLRERLGGDARFRDVEPAGQDFVLREARST